MAYLTFAGSEDNKSTCFKFIGTGNKIEQGGLIANNTSLISDCTSLLSDNSDGNLDTCSFYSGPSDSTIVAIGESYSDSSYSGVGESCGSIAYSGVGESCGSVAYSSSSSSGSCCSYSC